MRSLYGARILVWAVCGAGCVGPPTPADWLAVGFRSPAETFRTFQTALRSDQPDLEYRCLSTRFKRETVRNQALYRTFREELFRERPWVKYAAWGRILEDRELAPGHHRLIVEVDTWFFDRTFAVDFEREDYYELWNGEALLWDDFRPWRESAALLDDRLVVSVPVPAGVDLEEVSELRAGTQWKIAGFPLLETDPTP